MSENVIQSTRVRRTRAQWQQLLAAQSESGLTQRAYCTQHRIVYSSFVRWKRELERAVGDVGRTTSAAFVELTAAQPATASRFEVELELGEGVILRLRRS